jgi:NADPH:quinone reductase-like Zn-dependent oxidoreductase
LYAIPVVRDPAGPVPVAEVIVMPVMHAVRAHHRGGPEVLVYEDAPRPRPGEGEVLVAVRAAGVTASELTWDATWTDSFDGSGHERTPVIPSHEVSGVVAETGPGVVDPQVGTEVYGLVPFTHDGAAAEYVALPAELLVRKPANVDHTTAAAVPLAGLSAWQALVEHAGMKPGQHILVHGAAGGVGSFAVQIATALGGHVLATASVEDRAFVIGLGARDVVDYRKEPFEDHARHGVDVVLDTIGGETQTRSWNVLKRGGVLVSLAEPVDPAQAVAHRARGVFFVVKPEPGQLQALTRLIEDGRVIPAVDRVLPLRETRTAYEALESAHRHGKVVIDVAAPAPASA